MDFVAAIILLFRQITINKRWNICQCVDLNLVFVNTVFCQVSAKRYIRHCGTPAATRLPDVEKTLPTHEFHPQNIAVIFPPVADFVDKLADEMNP